MARKLILGIFLASLLLLTNLTLGGEKSSPAPAIAKVDVVSSDCDCFKKDSAPPSPGLRPDILDESPARANKQCWYCYEYCVVYVPFYGCLAWDTRCIWICADADFPKPW